MKNMKYLIIATVLATTLGPVSVYAMDQDREHKEAAAEGLTVEQVGAVLRAAAQEGDLEVFTRVLAVGANVNKRSNRGYNALMIAALKGLVGVVEQLLSAGAVVDKEDRGGWTPLMGAAQEGHVGVVKQLLNAGAVVDKEDRGGWTALMIASLQGHFGVVEQLLNARAEVDKKNNGGYTALIWAAEKGYVSVVEQLLNAGAVVDKEDRGGWTALMNAVSKDRVSVVETLLNAGAAVDKENNDGYTALMLATAKKVEEGSAQEVEARLKGATDLIIALFKAGGNVHQANRAGETVLSLASSDMLAAIVDARASMSPSEETFRCPQQDIQNVPIMLALAVASERPGQQRMVPWLLKSATQAREQAGDCSVCQESFTDLVCAKAELRRTNKACLHLVCDICEQRRLRSAAAPDDRNYGILYEDEEGREQWGGSRVPINLARCAVCRAENGSEFQPTADQKKEFRQLQQLFMEQERAATDADRHLAQAIQQSELEALQVSEDARAEVSNDVGGAGAQALQQSQPQPDADGFYD